MLDTLTDTWIKVTMPQSGNDGCNQYEELGGAVQIGVIPLPMHAYSTFKRARRHLDKKDYFEMIWFGGVGQQLLQVVHHCNLTLKYSDS